MWRPGLLSHLKALKSEVSERPALLEAAVFGYDDIYKQYAPFVKQWRAARTAAAASTAAAAAAAGGAPAGSFQAPPPLQPYVVSVDVSRAFDSVNIPRLLQLVEPLFRRPEYLMVRYSEVTPALGPKGVRTRHRMAVPSQPAAAPGEPPLPQAQPQGSAATAAAAAAVTAGGGGALADAFNFPRWAAVQHTSSYNAVLTDQPPYKPLSRASAAQLLTQHVSANILKIGRKWCAFRQVACLTREGRRDGQAQGFARRTRP